MAEKDVTATFTVSGNITLPILYDQGGLEVIEDFSAACVRFSLVTDSSGSQVSVNDTVTAIVMGYTGSSGSMLVDGYVDSITIDRPNATYTIEGRDKLKKAVDYFIVAASLDEADFFNPRLDNGHTAPYDIVDDILEECGLDLAYWSGGVGWTLGTADDGTPFQLVSAWDAIQQVCVIGVWKVWCDTSGSIHFGQITPAPAVSSSGSLGTGDGKELLSISYSKSDEDLRNKVVVIGANGDYTATASAVSAFLPANFYRTAVISTDLIGSNAMAQSSANDNLTRFNKLTERVTFEAEGDPSAHVQSTLTITETVTGVSGRWFVYEITHTIDGNGYIMRGTGVK